MKTIATALAALAVSTAAHAGCADAPDACALPDGEYHIALPADAENAPVMMFLHGAGSHGGVVMRNEALVASVTDRGYALLAPSAKPRRPGQSGGVWTFYPGWEGRNEPDFLARTARDAAEAFGVSPDRVLLAGFSAGAFMVTYLACDTPGAFPAYAPLAGAFWQPHPESCEGPVKLFQTHGWRDSTVPLEGRPLRNGTWLQGDIFASLNIWRDANKCPNMAPDSYGETGSFMRRAWTDCDESSALELALHPGGHSIPTGWVDMVLDWFEEQVP